ncbi:MAG: hypothetical protein QW040_00465 [Candidatus Aenigmatarchaeota archaeon]
MVKFAPILTGVVFLIVFWILAFIILPALDIQIPPNFYPFIWPVILLTSLPLLVSGFLPYKWGKIFRELSCFFLFTLVIILELGILKMVFVEYKPIEITLEICTSLFGSKEKPTEVWDILAVWSCTTLGRYPKSYSSLEWNVFFLFYILLPFAFIWTFLYGLMKGVGIEDFFNVKWVSVVLSFIIAMFSSRQIFGFFLLDFYGYGAWGLAGVFGAILFTKGVQKMMEGWYGIEQMAEETRKAVMIEMGIDKEVIKEIKMKLEEIKKLGTPSARRDALTTLANSPDSPLSRLSPAIREGVRRIILDLISNPSDKAINKVLKKF